VVPPLNGERREDMTPPLEPPAEDEEDGEEVEAE